MLKHAGDEVFSCLFTLNIAQFQTSSLHIHLDVYKWADVSSTCTHNPLCTTRGTEEFKRYWSVEHGTNIILDKTRAILISYWIYTYVWNKITTYSNDVCNHRIPACFLWMFIYFRVTYGGINTHTFIHTYIFMPITLSPYSIFCGISSVYHYKISSKLRVIPLLSTKNVWNYFMAVCRADFTIIAYQRSYSMYTLDTHKLVRYSPYYFDCINVIGGVMCTTKFNTNNMYANGNTVIFCQALNI